MVLKANIIINFRGFWLGCTDVCKPPFCSKQMTMLLDHLLDLFILDPFDQITLTALVG